MDLVEAGPPGPTDVRMNAQLQSGEAAKHGAGVRPVRRTQPAPARSKMALAHGLAPVTL